MSIFDLAKWREFLISGSVRTSHEQPVPIWAGFIIEQNAQIGHYVRGIMSDQDHIEADVAVLREVFTAVRDKIAEQGQAIDDLKAKVAAGTATPDDFTSLDKLTSDFAQLISAQPSNPVVSQPVDTTRTTPVVSEPVDTTTPTPVDSVPVVEPQAPVVSDPAALVPPVVTETPVDAAPADSTGGGAHEAADPAAGV